MGVGEPLEVAEKNKEMKVKMCGLSPHLVYQDDVITKFVSANQHFTQLFRCRDSNFLDVTANSRVLPSPAPRIPQRSCSQAIFVCSHSSLLLAFLFEKAVLLKGEINLG